MILTESVVMCRLFTYNEFAVFKIVVFWLFFQLHPTRDQYPKYDTVLIYFSRYSMIFPFASSLIYSTR